MAVAFASVSAVATATTGDVTVTKPTGLTVGDLMICFGLSNGASATFNLLAGWTSIQTNFIPNGTAMTSRAQYKIADSADVAASSFVFSGTSDSKSAVIYRITGHHPTSPINTSVYDARIDTANWADNGGTTITPSVANCLLLMFTGLKPGTLAISGQAITTSNPSWTEDFDNSTGPTIAGAHASRPETTATGAVIANSTGDATTDWHIIFIAIQPPIDVTVSPSVINATGAVLTPIITGGAVVSPSVINAIGAVVAPSKMGQADWSTQDKSDTASWSNLNKS